MNPRTTLRQVPWDGPEYLQAIDLIRRFFPEAKAFVSVEQGLDHESFYLALISTGHRVDRSCDPLPYELYEPEAGVKSLHDLGGVETDDAEILPRILARTGFAPKGRAVVVPDALGLGGFSYRPPFVCASRTLGDRLEEMDDERSVGRVFDGTHDTVLVFESGEALMLNHDQHLIWARSPSANR